MDGTITLASISDRKNFWVNVRRLYPFLARAGKEVIGFHTSTCAAERNWSAWGRTFSALRNKLDPGRAAKMIFIKANSRDQEADDKEVALTY